MIRLEKGDRILGTRFTYVAEAGRRGRLRVCCFRCDCGREVDRPLAWARNKTRSCGCLRIDNLVAMNRTHGCGARGKTTATFRSWQSMNQRVAGRERGYEKIQICRQWRWPNGFAVFLRDMGERPRGKTLDRIRNKEGYRPGNCRWATRSTQARNTRASVWVRWMGRRYHQLELMAKFEISYGLVIKRMQRGMNRIDAIITPIKRR